MAPKSKRVVKSQAAITSKPVAISPTRPDWPALSPLVPTLSLAIDPLVESQILLIHNLFTSSLCARYISFLSSLPLTTTPLTKSKDLAVRVNDRFQVEDAAFAEMLWSQTALKQLVSDYEDQTVWGDGRTVTGEAKAPELLGLNPNIRIYRYRPGQFFQQHFDDSNNLSFKVDNGQSIAAKTTWTLLIYLSICEGGETVFYPDRLKGSKTDPMPVAVAPEVGLGLLHRHGDKCMLHEGQKVLGGEKWVLRSDLVVRR